MTQDAHHWSGWFWNTFFADWLARVEDAQGGVFDALDADGAPDLTSTKTLLAQARNLFTLSHVALLSGDPAVIRAAGKQAAFLQCFEKAPGLYRCAANRDGTPTGVAADNIARSYDQTFVILGLVTWHKIAPSQDIRTRIEACWTALTSTLMDPVTGLLLNDDSGARTGPAQNPHMHLYEACLQAFRMTQDSVWLDRAAEIRAVGLRYFMDTGSGSIAEFLTPDLHPLPDAAGQRREVGHQCEWAWLLLEEATLAQDPNLGALAQRLIAFADQCGFAASGPLTGAVFDAVSATGDVVESSFLLWPQTEAIKTLAVRHTAGDPLAGIRAQHLMCLMFERWFKNRACFCNQLDAQGNVVWDQALTRLMYHLVIAMSEGAKARLWPPVPSRIIE